MFFRFDRYDFDRVGRYKLNRKFGFDIPNNKETRILRKEDLEKMNYNPLEIAREEFESGILPISVKQPMPKKKSVKIVKSIEKDPNKEELEEALEEKEIAEEGEIMELATPEDEEMPAEEVSGRESSEELQ